MEEGLCAAQAKAGNFGQLCGQVVSVGGAVFGRAAQARPGTRIRFVQVTEAEAIRLRREAEKKRKQLEYELLYGI